MKSAEEIIQAIRIRHDVLMKQMEAFIQTLQIPQVNPNLVSGFFAGILVSVGFHPVDRAFFLRSSDLARYQAARSLFSAKYWGNPFFGLRNSIYHRTFSSCLYFFLQGELNSRLKPVLEKHDYNLLSIKIIMGLIAGTITGIFLNPMNVIKYYSYQQPAELKLLATAIHISKQGGVHTFSNGMIPNIMRDSAFAITYEVLNMFFTMHILPHLNKKDSNSNYMLLTLSWLISAMIASTVSFPFNLVRNIQLATPLHEKQRSSRQIIADLWCESDTYVKESKINPYRARLGFFTDRGMAFAGTVRVGAGMMCGQAVVNRLKPVIEDLNHTTERRNQCG